jgi:hypothetical protein
MTLLMNTIAAGPAGHVQSSWVVATAQDVVGAAFLVGGSVFNPQGSTVYLQVFDAAAADVMLGTTEPVFSIAVPPGRRVQIRPPRPIQCANGMSFAATAGRTSATSPAGPISVQFEVGGVAALGQTLDPAAFIDDFESGDPLLENRGWTWYDEASVATQDMNGGELHLVSTTGGAAGAWWYNTEDGNLLFKTVTGDFDARVRLRVRNAAGTGSPSSAALEWRFAGIAVHDPDRSTDFNYVHAMLGADPNGTDRIEWKATDGSVSTWDSIAGAAPLDYDLRIVRVGQVFTLSYRAFDADLAPEDEGYVPLSDDDDWTTYQVIDRDDNTIPPRATAVNMPNTVQVGLTGGYAGPAATLDIQAWFREVTITQ